MAVPMATATQNESSIRLRELRIRASGFARARFLCLPVNCAFVSLSLSLFVVLPQLTLFVAPLDCALSLRADSLCSAGRALKLKRTVVDNGKCVTRNVCHLTANRMDSSAHSNSNLDANSKLELDSESESTSALDRKRGRKNERKPKTEMDFGGGSKSSVAFASFRFLCPIRFRLN